MNNILIIKISEMFEDKIKENIMSKELEKKIHLLS